LGHAGGKAAQLTARGVRRVFAIDVERARAFEWSHELGTWSFLDSSSSIEDRAFAVPLPVEPLLDAAKADDAIARALIAKRNPLIVAEVAKGREEGRVEGHAAVLRKQLIQKFGAIDAEQTSRIEGASPEALDRYLERVLTATTLAAVFAE
jgi:hypothetical protein